MSSLSTLARNTLLAAAFALVLVAAASAAGNFPNPPRIQAPESDRSGPQTAVLSGGCFWGMNGVFERLRGVSNVVSGYSGGSAATAHYDMVSSETTRQAETIRFTFDPSVISFGTLLKIYFSIAENPTELNYQGPDSGPSYRSVIFYRDAYQRQMAERYIEKIDRSHYYARRIVTEVVPFKAFYRAEAYHQHFLDDHPTDPYIVMWDIPKLRTLEKSYPQLIASRFRPDPAILAQDSHSALLGFLGL